jgi:hypothetical protein
MAPNEALVAPDGSAGKMIYVNGTSDTLMWPIGAATYDRKVRSHLGDATDDSYRLWWVEHHPHGNAELVGPFLTAEKDPGVAQPVRVADGVNQALRDRALGGGRRRTARKHVVPIHGRRGLVLRPTRRSAWHPARRHRIGRRATTTSR